MNDFNKYLKMDLWELQEGACLLLGQEPTHFLFMNRERFQYSHRKFWADFDELLTLAHRSIISGNLKVVMRATHPKHHQLSPSVFLLWAKGKSYEIPKELNVLLKELDHVKLVSQTLNSTPLVSTNDRVAELKTEARDGVIPSLFSEPVKTVRVTNDEIYNSIQLTQERRELQFKKIQNETPALRNQRITEDVDYYMQALKTQFPRNTISRKLTVKMVHRLDKLAYDLLNINDVKQPSEDSYVVYDRAIRSKQREAKKINSPDSLDSLNSPKNRI